MTDEQKLKAIRARIEGVWDDPDLRKIGPLNTTQYDVMRILEHETDDEDAQVCELCAEATATHHKGSASYCCACTENVLLAMLADAGAIIRDLELGYPRKELHTDPAEVVEDIALVLDDRGHTEKEEFLA